MKSEEIHQKVYKTVYIVIVTAYLDVFSIILLIS